MSDLPPPLVPPDVDLRDFAFMPLDVVRLRDSDIAALATGDEFRAAVMLWCASWHQEPAASLPNDEIVLSRLAGYGRVVREWKVVSQGALRGWVLCDDNRLYHPVIAEKANEAWRSKQRHAWSKECDRLRKENKRRTENGQTSVGIPTLEEWISNGSGADFQKNTPTVPTEPSDTSGGKPNSSDGNPAENALKGQGQGEGYKEKKHAGAEPGSDGRQAGNFWDSLEQRLCDAARPMPLGTNPDISAMSTMLDNGFSLELDILPAIEAAKRANKQFSTWDRMVGWVEQQNAGRKKAEGAKPVVVDKPAEPKRELSERNLIAQAVQFIEGRFWPFQSPGPGKPGTKITEDILEKARSEIAEKIQRRASSGEAA